MSKMQEVPARQSLSSESRCAGLSIRGDGGKRVEDCQDAERMGRGHCEPQSR